MDHHVFAFRWQPGAMVLSAHFVCDWPRHCRKDVCLCQDPESILPADVEKNVNTFVNNWLFPSSVNVYPHETGTSRKIVFTLYEEVSESSWIALVMTVQLDIYVQDTETHYTQVWRVRLPFGILLFAHVQPVYSVSRFYIKTLSNRCDGWEIGATYPYMKLHKSATETLGIFLQSSDEHSLCFWVARDFQRQSSLQWTLRSRTRFNFHIRNNVNWVDPFQTPPPKEKKYQL